MLRALTLLTCVLGAAVLRAHPEIEDGLARLNAQIAATPNDADLYVDRGELYARHEDWLSAEANYLRAAEFAPSHPRLPLVRGALELATGHPVEARRMLGTALGLDPKNAEALVLRARAERAVNDRASAVADLNAALALIPAPPPELYLERAALLDAPEAIHSLDEGLAKIGPAITLHLRALALEESLGRVDAAVARIDRIVEPLERKEAWLKRRGDLLRRAGRTDDARAAYRSALAAIGTLPEWLRTSPDTQKLVTELTELSALRS